MPETQVIAVEAGAVPHGYELAPGEVFQPLSLVATFDGTGAGGDFLPAVAIYSQNGRLLSRTFAGETVAAGDSAEVTFAPFLRETGGGEGIRFDIDNVGGFLEVSAGGNISSGALAPSSIGFETSFGGGIGFWDGNAGGGFTVITGPIGGSIFGGDGINLLAQGGGGFNVTAVGAAAIASSGSLDLQSGQTAHLQATNDVEIAPDKDLTGAGFLVLENLPVANPGGSGRVWNDAGTLKIT